MPSRGPPGSAFALFVGAVVGRRAAPLPRVRSPCLDRRGERLRRLVRDYFQVCRRSPRSESCPVRVFDLGNAAIVEKQWIGEGFFGGANFLDADTRLCSGFGPGVCAELGNGFSHGLPVVVQHVEFFGAESEAFRVFAHLQVWGRVEFVPFAGRQDKARTRRPAVDPAPVGTLEEALRRAAVANPGCVPPGA